MNEPLKTVPAVSIDFDLLDRYVSQVQSTLNALNHEDQLDELRIPTVMSILSLIEDRMEDISKVTYLLMYTDNQPAKQEVSA